MASAAVYQSRAAKTEATIRARSLEVFAGYKAWRFAHRKSDNHPFFMIDGSPTKQPDGTVVIPTYYTDLHRCTCPSHTDGRVACKHMRAVRLWFEAVKRGEIVVPRRMTAGDRSILEAEHAENEAMDVAEAADSLLDTYHAQLAKERAARFAESDTDWLDTGIVWLREGDRVHPDTLEVPASVPTCRQPGCDEPALKHEEWCGKHVLVDAF